MRIALAQIVSTTDPSTNAARVGEWTRRAADAGARLVVFPEATMCAFGVPLAPVAEPLDGPWADAVRTAADRAGITVVVGMFTPGPAGSGAEPGADRPRVLNTLLATGGGVEARYDKLHLYDAFGFAESRTVAPGEELVVITVDGVRVGLTTCYDVRFPALYQALAEAGAQATVVATSWGAGPGKREQWQVLTRARALDSGSWILAAAQGDPRTVGLEPSRKAPTGIGSSVVVSPTGVPVAEAGAAPELLLAEVDPDEPGPAREALGMLANRRPLPRVTALADPSS
ncbi:carbon-nitrogen hydrolase family protein [Nakamurella leprariae]|uniref:Carbon-nitrogen hydrolase family protein n=1 Tax=Nakamurella leprariae TaxID=2803911 RepID=A0A938YHX2_9ACTN|nr:carbon-nitrogen hydrolase family protein [Nakamurella leprariae]MBM9468153.1 carbon-nitrogen hydrolase family protein [Nakamurella leprariae]